MHDLWLKRIGSEVIDLGWSDASRLLLDLVAGDRSVDLGL